MTAGSTSCRTAGAEAAASTGVDLLQHVGMTTRRRAKMERAMLR